MTFEDLPEAMTSRRNFPRAVKAALVSLAEARAAAEDADRALRRTSLATHVEEEEERRRLTTEGDLPAPNAADERTARVAVATRDLRVAERNLARAERDAAAASSEHAPTIQALATRVAVEAQADVVQTGEAFVAALALREQAYALAGYPGENTYGPLPDAPGQHGQVYFLRRSLDAPRFTNADGIELPTLHGTIDRISAAIHGFPLAGAK